mmetsp:Transcript_26539/g.66781  ORF Transcript_26539/g.66781 Transcript_26539/m.66781 type:complete len:216 (-) Transcript_26539:34-681(-)|eukprot:CAMPEP_0177644502 /NCGR_PEP_ID=MMETSP0447-20121125/8725_1 /TAXON_ID=0 /ORGANISM="Stygamoeba regulata, Strain BSH-02190019" /LENGTH=215 /DNA_ID=CAMNT_0019146873 /DNA_START=49 /DNA_END=696 /DNA_ORIENTATION=+
MDIDGVDFSGEDLLADELVDDINTDEVIDDADLTMDDLLDPSALTDDANVSGMPVAVASPSASGVAHPIEGMAEMSLPVAGITSPVPSSFATPGPSPASPGFISTPIDDAPLRSHQSQHQGFLQERASASLAAQKGRREEGSRQLQAALSRRKQQIAQTAQRNRQEQEISLGAQTSALAANPWSNVGNLVDFQTTKGHDRDVSRMKSILIELQHK